jgi:ketosteroid isomerase-like protein
VQGRRASPIDLVSNLRSAVRDWREAFYIGARDTTIQLLNYWFGRAHRQPTASGEDFEFRYYFCQREAIETLIDLLGRASVRQTITAFFATIQGLRHHLIKAWEYETTVIFQAEVTYIRKDGSQVTIPYVDVLELESDRIKDYKIYIDLAPLQQL